MRVPKVGEVVEVQDSDRCEVSKVDVSQSLLVRLEEELIWNPPIPQDTKIQLRHCVRVRMRCGILKRRKKDKMQLDQQQFGGPRKQKL